MIKFQMHHDVDDILAQTELIINALEKLGKKSNFESIRIKRRITELKYTMADMANDIQLELLDKYNNKSSWTRKAEARRAS